MFAFSAAPTILHKNSFFSPRISTGICLPDRYKQHYPFLPTDVWERDTEAWWPCLHFSTSKCLQPHKHKTQNLPDKQALPTRMQMAKSDFGPGFRHFMSVPCLPEILKLIRANLHGLPFEGLISAGCAQPCNATWRAVHTLTPPQSQQNWPLSQACRSAWPGC